MMIQHPYLQNTVALTFLSAPPSDDGPSAGGRAVSELVDFGGEPFAEKVMGIERAHGRKIASIFTFSVLSDGTLKELYLIRRKAAVVAKWSSKDGDIAPIVAQINAIEVQLLQAILREDARATAERRPTPPRVPLPERVGFRDVKGEGGYIYRQYADNTIAIVQSPRGGTARVVERETDAWRAILREIGPYPAHLAVAPRSLLAQLQALLPQLVDVARAFPGVEGRVVRDALKVGTAAVSAATAGPPAVAALLAAAGFSAGVPIAGWIVAGGLGLAAGTIALANILTRGRHSRKDIVRLARELKIPDAERVPVFAANAMRWTSERRIRTGEHIEKVLTASGRRYPAAQRQRIEARLRVLAAIELLHRARERAASRQEDSRRAQRFGEVVYTAPPFGWLT